MLDYREHRFELPPGPDLATRIESALRIRPERAREALDGWLARRADLDPDGFHVESANPDGFLELSFRETQWLACRLETGTAPHRHRIAYRLEGSFLVLRTLPRDAFGERVDDL